MPDDRGADAGAGVGAGVLMVDVGAPFMAPPTAGQPWTRNVPDDRDADAGADRGADAGAGVLMVDVGAPFMALPTAGQPWTRNVPDDRGADAGAINRAPTLGDVVRAFKARVSVAINRLRTTSGTPIWQRNYYEHIIRNDQSLNRIRQYIRDNPSRWAHDRENANALEPTITKDLSELGPCPAAPG